MLTGKRIVVGICGCSTANKALDLIAALKKQHADVYAVMTENATHFVTPLMVQRSVGHPISMDAFELPRTWEKDHKPLDSADLLLIAPASANTLGKAAWGIADGLLTTVIMSTRGPILFATHINDKMYSSPSVQRNIRTLKQDGVHFVDNNRPEHPGLFPPIDQTVSAALKILGAEEPGARQV